MELILQFGLLGAVAFVGLVSVVLLGGFLGLFALGVWVWDRAPAWFGRASDWDLRRARRAAVRRLADAPPTRLAEHPLNRSGSQG